MLPLLFTLTPRDLAIPVRRSNQLSFEATDSGFIAQLVRASLFIKAEPRWTGLMNGWVTI